LPASSSRLDSTTIGTLSNRAPIEVKRVEPLDVGQPEIENDEVGFLRPYELEGGATVRSLENLITLRAEPQAQQFADWRLVVNDQHLLRRGALAAGSSRLAAASGSRIVNTAPGRSARLAAVTVP
jgi:hypothetical protein